MGNVRPGPCSSKKGYLTFKDDLDKQMAPKKASHTLDTN